jgi:integrase
MPESMRSHRPKLQQFVNNLEDAKGASLSNRSRKYTLAAVRQVFGYAQDEAKYIAVVPRAKAPSVPRTSITEKDVLNEEQAFRFLAAAQDEPCWDLLKFMLETGARIGEGAGP